MICLGVSITYLSCTHPQSTSATLEEPLIDTDSVMEAPVSLPPPLEVPEPVFEPDDLVRLDSAFRELNKVDDSEEQISYFIEIRVSGETSTEATWELDAETFQHQHISTYFSEYSTEEWEEIYFQDGLTIAIKDSSYVEDETQDGWYERIYSVHRDLCPRCGIFAEYQFDIAGNLIDSTLELRTKALYAGKPQEITEMENHFFEMIAQRLDSITLPSIPPDSASDEEFADYEAAMIPLGELSSFEMIDSLYPTLFVRTSIDFDPELAPYFKERLWKKR